MKDPFVSVVVAVKNGEKTLAKCVQSLLAQEYPRFEVIVVDDGSTDATPRVLASFLPRITVISNPRNLGPSESRNIAAARAAGQYLAFIDGDCIADRRWLTELMKCFAEGDAAGGGGTQGVPADESRFGRVVARFLVAVGFMTGYMRAARAGIGKVEHNASCNSAYRRDVFLSVGGFLPGLWPGEDVELDYRLRKKRYILRCNPAARVAHYRTGTVSSFCRMLYRYGAAQGILTRKYGFFRKAQYLSLTPFLALALLGIALAQHTLLPFAGACALAFLALFRFDIRLAALGVLAFVAWTAGFYIAAVSWKGRP